MSEHEISKQAKAVYTVWTNPHLKWKEKVMEIAIEVAIIVFAITLSLMVERWRENVHERGIEKDFLVDLKTDLNSDLAQEADDSASYALMRAGWNYFYKCGINGEIADDDSVKKYGFKLFNTTIFISNNSRFEGMKSSGQLIAIENKKLLNLILDLYQYKIAGLNLTNDVITFTKQHSLIPFVQEKLIQKKDGTNNLAQLFFLPQMQNYLASGGAASEAVERYHEVMAQSRQIIAMINEQYPEK
ncbi:MAG TPA: hypothetical protein VHZ50_06560 [Puia sp.]|jgi:hypothetical protein|nr:hypothetical protein [Puia sp.]